jgi:hypothetical protein
MRYRTVFMIWLLVAAAAGACFWGKKEAEATAVSDAPYKAGEIVVLFKADTTPAEIDAAVAATGGEISERSDANAARVIIAVPTGEEDAYVKKYTGLENVRAADKNYEAKAFTGGGK